MSDQQPATPNVFEEATSVALKLVSTDTYGQGLAIRLAAVVDSARSHQTEAPDWLAPLVDQARTYLESCT